MRGDMSRGHEQRVPGLLRTPSNFETKSSVGNRCRHFIMLGGIITESIR